MNIVDYLIIIATFSAIQFLAATWVKGKIETSIKHAYDKKFLEYQHQLARRQKSEQLAYAFARWIKYRGAEEKWLSERELVDYYEELTRLSYELILYLEDETLLTEVMKKFQNLDDSKSTEQIIVEVRKLLQGKEDNLFTFENVVSWPKDISFLTRGPRS
ncbi:MAG TPA: hypothetical protein VGE53_00275 [Candidatus Paceibacterota bacterium]